MLDYFSKALKGRLQDYLSGRLHTDCKWEDHEGRRDPMDEVDLASARYQEDFMLHMRQRNHQFIQEIAQALQRIENGDFGVCEECGDDIALERLKVQPMTRVCVHCKKELENAERRKLGKTQAWNSPWPLEMQHTENPLSTKIDLTKFQ